MFAAPLQLDYYGVVSSAADSNMLKMAQDIFFTQLSSIDNLSIADRRPDISSISRTVPDTSSTTDSKVIFYAEINEDKIEEATIAWKCSFNAKRVSDGKLYSKNETYDSYYKILTNARASIEELLAPLYITTAPLSEKTITQNQSINPEILSGTWSGEPGSDKIVILRGGRGFIIFKNGATMNISVQIEDSNENSSLVKIKQVGKSNASFFPELSRETALAAAQSAPPIEWNFTLSSQNILSGSKKTLIRSSPQSESVVNGTQKVTWTKK